MDEISLRRRLEGAEDRLLMVVAVVRPYLVLNSPVYGDQATSGRYPS